MKLNAKTFTGPNGPADLWVSDFADPERLAWLRKRLCLRVRFQHVATHGTLGVLIGERHAEPPAQHADVQGRLVVKVHSL